MIKVSQLFLHCRISSSTTNPLKKAHR